MKKNIVHFVILVPLLVAAWIFLRPFIALWAILTYGLTLHSAGLTEGFEAGPDAESALDAIRLPPGFKIEAYAADVPGARSMTLGPDNLLFVGTRGGGKVYAVTDPDGDRSADETIVLASGLRSPNGVAWHKGNLYVAEIGRILRFDGIAGSLRRPPKPVILYEGYPEESHHGWKFIAVGPDEKLYVPVGAPCNICDPGDPYASITRINLDGSGFEIVCRGVRNTVGFDWEPGTGNLWFTDNGRDWLGDDKPSDELNKASRTGLHFGFPYFHGLSDEDPTFGKKGHGDYVLPELELGPHVAALGMRFYEGDMFPPQYRGDIFIAEHGSWNRSVPVGYRIVRVRMAGGRAVSQEVFADGWLRGERAWGRPVDVEVLGDGSLLVSDDKAGAIYRISRVKE